jgi:hypothetical protein
MPSVAIESRKHAANRPRATVAQARVGLQVDQRIKVGTELGAGGFGVVVNAHGHQGVGQGPPGQELHAEVVHALGILVVGGGQGFAPAVHGAVAHGVEQGKQPVAAGGRAQVFAHGVHQTVGNGFAQRVDRVVKLVVLERGRAVAQGGGDVGHGVRECKKRSVNALNLMR